MRPDPQVIPLRLIALHSWNPRQPLPTYLTPQALEEALPDVLRNLDIVLGPLPGRLGPSLQPLIPVLHKGVEPLLSLLDELLLQVSQRPVSGRLRRRRDGGPVRQPLVEGGDIQLGTRQRLVPVCRRRPVVAEVD